MRGLRRLYWLGLVSLLVFAGGIAVLPRVSSEGVRESLQTLRLQAVAKTGLDPLGPILDVTARRLPAGVALVVVGGVFALAWRSRASGSGLGGRERKERRQARRMARRLSQKGEHEEAAELLLAIEDQDAAADAFVRAGEWVRAAEVCHDQNRFLEAAEHYLEAGELESAAVIFAQQEVYLRAAECYLEVGSDGAAAEMFIQAGDWSRAADCYRSAELLEQASQCYVQASRSRLAAECLEAHLRAEAPQRRAGDVQQRDELAAVASRAADLYLKVDDADAAIRVLRSGGWDQLAAKVAFGQQDFRVAAELFERVGDRASAADALRKLGNEEEAARLLGEHLRAQGNFGDAAHQLRIAGDFLGAGDLFRQADDPKSAAECYAEHEDHAQAAEMYELLGERGAAAASWERACRWDEAAECHALLGQGEREAESLERAGRLFEAGRAFLREGLDDRAIAALQQVEGGDACEAAALVAEVFCARGQADLAVRQLLASIGEAELRRETLPLFHALAVSYEAAGREEEALVFYDRVCAVDYHRADVSDRASALRARLGARSGVRLQAGRIDGGGRYEIVGELGRGGMGIVYEAQDSVLERRVAFKVLPDSFRENAHAVGNFLREAKAAAKLNHPNIVTVFDAGEQAGRYYIAMEFVDGVTLKDILSRRGALGIRGVLNVLIQLSGALAYAHEQGVVHRDVKTSNAMWTRDRSAKIMDFGLARVVEEVRNHTTVVAGTPCYMSPEQTLGRNIDHRTDIYSLGVTGFELLTGRLPFVDGNIPYHHVHTAPPAVSTLRDDVPAALAALVHQCLAKEASERFQSARALLAAAESVRGDMDPSRVA